jgi:hypothetical protein
MQTRNDDWSGTGYDAKPGGSGGVYLRLKEKGEKVRVRIVSDCYRYMDFIPQPDGSEKPVKRAAWLVIHKELVDGKPVKSVKVFQNGPMVYGLVKDLTENPEWGDPSQYDIEIARTEEQGKYYTVLAMPKPFGPISDEEQTLVIEADIDLEKACSKDHAAPSPSSPEKAVDPFDE